MKVIKEQSLLLLKGAEIQGEDARDLYTDYNAISNSATNQDSGTPSD
jgi:hypothetical protein